MTHLPEGAVRTENARGKVLARHFTEEQMIAYGASERERALEEAALLCDGIAQRNWATTLAAQCAEVIRALKEKP